jgi:hypothetical protein
MALRPVTLAKNWQFNVNQKILDTGNSTNNFRSIMKGYADSMLGFASNPWTCVGSSDSVTSNLTGTNLWSAIAKLVWATTNGTAHSWIVLKNTAGLGTFQLLISLLGGATGFQARIAFSVGGLYVGGSNTTDPTATDEVVVLASANWTDSTYGTGIVAWASLHVEQSVDGQCTRIWHHTQQGLVNGCLFIESLLNAPSAFSPATAVFALGSSSQVITFGNLVTASNWFMRVNGVSATGRLALLGSGTVLPNDSGNGTNFDNDVDGGWPVCPVGLNSFTAGARGSLGTFQDMHVVTSQLRVGQILNTPKTFVSLQPLVMPWNSTDMLVGG